MQQPDVSALGAALLAGLKVGVYPDVPYLKALLSHQEIEKKKDRDIRKSYLTWREYVKRK